MKKRMSIAAIILALLVAPGCSVSVHQIAAAINNLRGGPTVYVSPSGVISPLNGLSGSEMPNPAPIL